MTPDLREAVYIGESADSVWRMAASDMQPGGIWKHQQSRGGKTREILHAQFAISDPRRRWVYSRHPVINPAAYLVEIIWILGGRNDSMPIDFFIPPYPSFAGKGTTYHGAYGHRLRKHFRIDQLERAYDALSSNPGTRQVVLQIWDPAADFPQRDGKPSAEDIPCNVSSLLKVRDGALEWTQIVRSNDIYRGVPVNFVQFTTLQEVLAGWLDLELGNYRHWSDSLHLYEENYETVSNIGSVGTTPEPTHSFALPKHKSETAIECLNTFLDWVVSASPSKSDLTRQIATLELPDAYQDTAYLMAADAAFRFYNHSEYALELCNKCRDHRLSFLWKRWCSRLKSQ